MNINEKTRAFIRQHADEDVRKVALLGAKDPEVDLQTALQQIAGRQTARRKLPSWATVEDIVYPPHLNMEQCSSEQTARYKARLVGKGDSFTDLTGGFGVDFYWMSQGFSHRYYVERDEALCTIAETNFRQLSHPCSVSCCDTAAYLATMERASVVYLDPARRNKEGGRTYSIEDCTPNVLELLPLLMTKAELVVVKLSPMLDWRKAVDDIEKATSQPQAHVHEVHIVSVDNECKELLLLLRPEPSEGLRLVCVNNDSIFEITKKPSDNRPSSTGLQHGQGAFLYEPNASIMKAGCFAELEQRFAVCQIASNSHLFLSDDEMADFPGRSFQILAVSSMNKQEIKEKINKKFSKSLNPSSPMERANIAVRNFPLTAEQLRKKLKLKDGGDMYIFATTLADGQHRLFFCRKIG